MHVFEVHACVLCMCVCVCVWNGWATQIRVSCDAGKTLILFACSIRIEKVEQESINQSFEIFHFSHDFYVLVKCTNSLLKHPSKPSIAIEF